MKKIYLIYTLLFFLSSFVIAKSPQNNYQAFGQLAMIQHPTVSPDGTKIIALYNSSDGPSVVISDFGGQEITTLVKLKKSQDRIDSVYWINDTRILIEASYSQKISDRRFRATRLFAVNIDGSDLRELNRRSEKTLAEWEKVRSSFVSLISLMKSDEKHILVQFYDLRDEADAVYKVNVYDGKVTKLFANTYNVHSWTVNDQDDVVFGYGTDKKEKDVRTIWYRKNNKADWELLHKQKAYKGSTFTPILVQDNKLLVISDRENRRAGLWQYDIKLGKFEKLLYAHEKFDIEGVLYNSDRNRVVGVLYFDNFRKDHYFDKSDVGASTIVKNSFKGYHTSIYSRSKNKKQLLVRAEKDNSPTKFFWLDLKKKKGGLWFSQYPSIERVELSSVTPFSFITKDKVELNGYLTLPTNVDEKPPLVVWPHGGPIGVRDYQYFNPFVQYFASLGYAVLQVNYRGSGGFGSDFQTSGYREWGKLMQSDVYETIDWLAQKNLVDMNKACLVGASYGGYVALTAAFQRPKQFKCIASIAGVSDLLELAEDDYRWKGSLRAHVVNEIGDPTKDKVAEELANVSVINHINKIKAPILLIHGRYDTQVRVTQSVDFYNEAKDEDIDIKYVEFKYGTHYLDNNENRLETFKEIGEFLAKHLN